MMIGEERGEGGGGVNNFGKWYEKLQARFGDYEPVSYPPLYKFLGVGPL